MPPDLAGLNIDELRSSMHANLARVARTTRTGIADEANAEVGGAPAPEAPEPSPLPEPPPVAGPRGRADLLREDLQGV